VPGSVRCMRMRTVDWLSDVPAKSLLFADRGDE
jgi:hypothetical protein